MKTQLMMIMSAAILTAACQNSPEGVMHSSSINDDCTIMSRHEGVSEQYRVATHINGEQAIIIAGTGMPDGSRLGEGSGCRILRSGDVTKILPPEEG